MSNQPRPIKIELYRSDFITDGEDGWRWTAKRGGRTIAASTEAYSERVAAVRNIALVFGIPALVRHSHGKRVVDFLTYRPEDSVEIEVKTR